MPVDVTRWRGDNPPDIEAKVAQLTIEVMREEGISDASILRHFVNHTTPAEDRIFEREVFQSSGVQVDAGRVKAHMRRLLSN